jgi:predicted ABC-type ATPase
MSQPFAVIIAGPNGAGKSSAAPYVLQGSRQVEQFLNADVIAAELSPLDPAAVAIEAGRIFLDRVAALIKSGDSFAWETTLSGGSTRHLFANLKDAGYESHLVYLWLPTVEMSIERVRRRVELGGHDIPEQTVRRRFSRGLINFQTLYRPLASEWQVYDNRDPGARQVIAAGRHAAEPDVFSQEKWREFTDQCDAAGKVREPRSSYAGATMTEPNRTIGRADAARSRLVENAFEIDRAITLAHGDVIRRHRAHGVPIVLWRDGRVQSVDANTVAIPDPDAVVPAGV